MNTQQAKHLTASHRAARSFSTLGLVLLAACGGSSGGDSIVTPDPVLESLELEGSLTPHVGPAFGGTLVRIDGSGFIDGVTGPMRVLFGGVEATELDVLDDATLMCVTPAGTPGSSAEVTIETADGTSRLTESFGFLERPEIVSDLNGDGVADLVIGAPRHAVVEPSAGAVFVFFGSDAGNARGDRPTTLADLTVLGQNAMCHFGSSVATGDLDGDGQDDLVVGAELDDAAGTDAGAVYVFLGPLTGGELTSNEADLVLTGDTRVEGDRFGSSLAIGDIDDDGAADLAVGAPRHDTGADAPDAVLDAGAVYVFLDVALQTSTSSEFASLRFDGEAAGSRLGNRVLFADLSGDGVDDLAMGSTRHDPVHPPLTQDAGAVYVTFGSGGSGVLTGGDVASADVVLYGTALGDEFGHSLEAGDLSRDGIDDLIVGVPRQDTLGYDVGRVYVFHGGEDLTSGPAESADVFLEGQPTNDAFGVDLSAADVNGDGFDDLLVGANDASFKANGNGRAYLFLGGETFGPAVATGADFIYTGEYNDADGFGECAKLVDRNLDGLADLIVGAPGNDEAASGAGRVYVFDGEQFMTRKHATEDDWTLSGMDVGAFFGASMADGE